MKSRSAKRLALVVIAALFIFPIVLAWLMYSGAIDFRPGVTRNLGRLVQPPVPVAWDGVLMDGDVPESASQTFAGHWLILHAVPRPCPETCMQAIAGLRQIHRAAGRQQSRIRLALLHDPDAVDSAARLQQIYAPFRLIEDPDGRLWQTLEAIAAQTDPTMPPRGSTYLIDPLGNIMMFYAAGSDPNDLNKDLKRLLAWSKLDEQP